MKVTNNNIKWHDKQIANLMKKINEISDNNKPVENKNTEYKSVVVKGFLR